MRETNCFSLLIDFGHHQENPCLSICRRRRRRRYISSQSSRLARANLIEPTNGIAHIAHLTCRDAWREEETAID